MATKKRRKKVAPVSKAGRKKEIKRFILEKWSGGDAADDVLKANEIAFVVKTSGGTPLNTTDLNKLWRLLQHELRALGHKLVRKGQPLDPEPKPQKAEAAGAETPTDVDPVHDNGTPNDPDEPSPDESAPGSHVADLSDPDDPHPNQQ